jgi:hypothetical protein
MLRFLDSETNFTSPKARKKMSAGELHYVDVKVPQRAKDLWRMRARARAKEATLDLAAEALAAQAEREANQE